MTMKTWQLRTMGLLAVLCLACVGTVRAATVDISTGIADDGSLIAGGAADDDWSVVSFTTVAFGNDFSTFSPGTTTSVNKAAVVMSNIPSAYFDPAPDAQWITQAAGNLDPGIYTFAYTLGTGSAVSRLQALAAGDNPIVEIRIDDLPIPFSERNSVPEAGDGRKEPFRDWAYEVSGLLQPGRTLEIDVLNYKSSPMGLAVSGVVAPSPTAFAGGLALVGLALASAIRRRRGANAV
jgi:MYXO-CTERM domain-containing protein